MILRREIVIHKGLLKILSKVTNSGYRNYVCFTVYKFINTGNNGDLNNAYIPRPPKPPANFDPAQIAFDFPQKIVI
jgi:hypothetical protein